jgi:hypothetical protein
MSVLISDVYGVNAVLDGIQKARTMKRPLFFQSFTGNRGLSDSDNIRMDIEFAVGNPMGQPVNPDVEAPELDTPQYGHRFYEWTYVKELVSSRMDADFRRRIGEVIGAGGDPVVALQQDFLSRQVLSLNAMDNYEELFAGDLLLYGNHLSKSEFSNTVYFDFFRPKVTTDAEYLAGDWSLANLTGTDVIKNGLTIPKFNGNGGIGKRAWNATGGTIAVDPVQDMKTWCHWASRDENIEACLMSFDAYEAYYTMKNSDKYKALRDLTINVSPNDRLLENLSAPMEEYEGVTLQTVDYINGHWIPIYTYDGKYTLRNVANVGKQAFMPNGYVILIPSKDNQVKRYGRIQHFKAGWAAMPLWINQAMNEWTGAYKQEFHRALFMGLKQPNRVKTIKVM